MAFIALKQEMETLYAHSLLTAVQHQVRCHVKDCIEEPDGHVGVCQVTSTVASTNFYSRPE